MKTSPEHRKSKRFDHRATVILEDGAEGFFNYGLMLNYSSGGMYTGLDSTYTKGTPIKIIFSKPPYKAAPTTYSGTVRWCKELARDDFEYFFGVGIKYD